jgi:hypothetical protein
MSRSFLNSGTLIVITVKLMMVLFRCGVLGPWRTYSVRSWRINWRPRPTSPAYTRPRYFRYLRVFPDPVPVSVFHLHL